MNRIEVPPLRAQQLAELEGLYQTRAQMLLLSSEEGLKAKYKHINIEG